MTAIVIRPISPADSLEDLTALLQSAFAPMGLLGLNCTCVNQTVEVTKQRIERGQCFVATFDEKIVGTLAVYAADRQSCLRWYRHSRVASIHQFAVDPAHQRTGVGDALLRTAETWARGQRNTELALDTPEPAGRLRKYYRKRNFRLVDTVQLEGKSYRSVVLSKSLGSPVSTFDSEPCMARHPLEMTLLRSEKKRRAYDGPLLGSRSWLSATPAGPTRSWTDCGTTDGEPGTSKSSATSRLKQARSSTLFW